MSSRAKYTPGPVSGVQVNKEGEKWTLVMVRQLRHSPERVWEALTDPAQLSEWSPFDSDRNLGSTGTARLTWVGAPQSAFETTVTRAEAPRVLEFNDIRWELEPSAGGTRLTLWASIDRRFVAMGAAGWHVCIDVLDHLLAGDPIGRIAGPEAMQFEGWQRLHSEYSKEFGVEMPAWTG